MKTLLGTIKDHEDILESLNGAVLKMDEARGIAAAEFGDKDPRTLRIESVWAEVYTSVTWCVESIEYYKGQLPRTSASESVPPDAANKKEGGG